MINWDRIDKKISIKKVILPLLVVILILLIIFWAMVLNNIKKSTIFVKSYVTLAEKNEKPVFSVDRIYLCSSANAVDVSAEKNLKLLELYQYTDIAIYLKNQNGNQIENYNSVKELYIDNIQTKLVNETNNKKIGETRLYYTNLLKIGSKDEVNKLIGDKIVENSTVLPEKKERISFDIINNNKENAIADYDKPTFYADCSNPISLKYINKLQKKYTLEAGNLANFDGSILEKAGITLEDIECKIKFKINIVSNDNEHHSSWVSFKIPLNDIYEGTSIRSKTVSNNDFFVGGRSFLIGDGPFCLTSVPTISTCVPK